jgi:hypothetical protein
MPMPITAPSSVALLACALGLAGAVVPAIRAACANIADALHES